MCTRDSDWGYKAQHLGNDILKKFAKKQTARPPAAVDKPPVREQVIHFTNKEMPGNLPKKTARALLDVEDNGIVPIVRNPKITTPDNEVTFYFPGCDSERLFSQVDLATQAMLWHTGVQTMLPPGYLCCGYLQRGTGQFDKAKKTVTDNHVLFHRVANTLNYLGIKTVMVSCGTCYDQLAGYEFDKISSGCRIIDIYEYLLEKGVKTDGVQGTRYMHHDPCHTSIKTMDPTKLVNQPMGGNIDADDQTHAIEKNDRCCGESGTLAISRPGISTQVRFRKEEEVQKGANKLRSLGQTSGQGDEAFNGDVKILTSCPACLQGLSRYTEDVSVQTDYIMVEMVRHMLGEIWLQDYVAQANAGGIEQVLV